MKNKTRQRADGLHQPGLHRANGHSRTGHVCVDGSQRSNIGQPPVPPGEGEVPQGGRYPMKRHDIHVESSAAAVKQRIYFRRDTLKNSARNVHSLNAQCNIEHMEQYLTYLRYCWLSSVYVTRCTTAHQKGNRDSLGEDEVDDSKILGETVRPPASLAVPWSYPADHRRGGRTLGRTHPTTGVVGGPLVLPSRPPASLAVPWSYPADHPASWAVPWSYPDDHPASWAVH